MNEKQTVHQMLDVENQLKIAEQNYTKCCYYQNDEGIKYWQEVKRILEDVKKKLSY